MTTTNHSTLRAEVATLISDVEATHRYSMSRIYGLYNRVFETDERPQSCASCLIRKVRELRNWLASQTDTPVEKPKRKRSKK
ncbi:hypothetical protein [Dysgonomonas sp. 25]|uniref:hypothetical protein n=1 Tax=Dysgonomonas sp. 25 TaxID=2302933 RepID=UPI0013D62D48|nr:hypothetical protein [Dysgonomonas sp. 25]NDV69300.1 hypothetical protein [Dysgonomonas sp. 25]